MTLTGGCLCGAARYQVEGEIGEAGICHCKNCQRQSGTAFSVNIAVQRRDVTLSGELKTFVDSSDSGEEVLRRFCANCGSPLFSELSRFPDMIVIKTGTLDDTSAIKPAFEVWSKRKQCWVAFDHTYPSFVENSR